MKKAIIFFSLIIAGCASAALAQNQVIGAEQVVEWMTGGKKVAVIDVRSYEEYRSGHIPGAINIPADRIEADRSRLPRDKTRPLIFYCRGAG